MKLVMNLAAVLVLLGGTVFFLQGINLLPGSFMTGQSQWAVIGAIMILLGGGWLIAARRRPL